MQNQKNECGLPACPSQHLCCDSFLNESCSTTMANIAGWKVALPILCANAEHLPASIITAGWTNRMRTHRAAALRAFAELRRMPAIRGFTRAQSHLRGSTFWDAHIERLTKAEKAGKNKSRVVLFPQLQLIERPPVMLAFSNVRRLRNCTRFRHLRSFANAATVTVAVRIGRQVQ